MDASQPGHLIAVQFRALRRAVDLLVDELGVERLRSLDIRAGEHLAAILTTCFLGRPPTAIDEDGGPDLVFDNYEPGGWWDVWLSEDPPAFEVKSIPGPFRKYDDVIDRIDRRGGDPYGKGVTVRIQSAQDFLVEMQPLLLRAAKQLDREVGPDYSRHAFIVVHPFDKMIPEFMEVLLGPHLPLLKDSGGLASVWLLWVRSPGCLVGAQAGMVDSTIHCS